MAFADFESHVKRLTPLFQEADERHRQFKAGFKEGQATVGSDDYKRTADYRKQLDLFNSAQKQLEAESDSILKSLRKGNPGSAIAALAYLSIRHRPFQSGWVSQRLGRALMHVRPDAGEREILRQVLLDRITWPWCQSRQLWRLISAVRTREFDQALRSLASHENPHVRNRARKIFAEYATPSPTKNRP